MKVFGTHEPATLAQFRDVASRAEGAALMADGHVGYVMPIGGVAAYRDRVSVVGVGFDIACGNAAIRTDLTVHQLGATPEDARRTLTGIADEIASTVSFGIGRRNRADDAPVDDPLFDDEGWDAVPARERETLKTKARQQLGTVGSGNHYVDVFADEAGTIWVGVHFGSRGFGHTVASAFLALGQNRKWGERAPEQEVLLDVTAPIGHDYWTLMNLAGRYAYAGREWVARKVVQDILGAHERELVHNHHNFCIAGDATVPTTAGPKRMADVRAGDQVYAFDVRGGLTPTLVLRQWQSGTRSTRTLRTASRAITVTDDHPVLVVEVERRPHPTRPWLARPVGTLRFKPAGDVARGDVLVCAAGYYPEDQSAGEERARLVGAMLGDGWIRHEPSVQGYTVGLAIGAKDEPHTARYEALVADMFPSATWRSNVRGAFGLTCSSVDVWREMVRLGVGGYSNEKRVPAWAFRLPRAEKLALLSGYVDADGSVADGRTSNHGRATLASVSRQLIQDLRELAIGCGLRATKLRSAPRETNFGRCVVHMVVLSADSTRELSLWHGRKAANARATRYRHPMGPEAEKIGYLELPPGTFAQRVLGVDESVIAEPVYDLTIEHPSHAFVCDGVVVHNCWREIHGGEELLVVRKGATPAFPGQKGFIGGSMGDAAVIVQGATPPADSPLAGTQRDALYSTIHGAGRVMSRTQAAGKRNRKTGQVLRPGRVTPEMMKEWIDAQGVILRGGGLDESPHVYRRLPEVLAAQEHTVDVLHTLEPLVVVMAGADEFDPYKD